MQFRRMVMATAVVTLFASPAFAPAFAQDPEGVEHDGIVAQFDPDDFVSLGAEPGVTFADMPVEAPSGVRIGTVRSVGLTADGSAASVLVDLYAGGSVRIVADALRYNRNARLLLTNMKHIESSVDRNPF